MIDRLLRLLTRLVPAARRDEWLREWRGELAHQRSRGAAGPRVLLAAAEDAVGLRLRNPGTLWMAKEGRLAARALARRPVFSAVVVGTLALGIGANTAVFSVLYDTLLRPLPYEAPQELVSLEMVFRSADHGTHPAAASEPEYLDLDAEADFFAELAAYSRSGFNLGGLDRPERVTGATVTPDFLELLGVTPILGRDFVADDGRPGAERAVILSHGLWRRALGGDPGAVGSTILLDDRPHRVVGVLPETFTFPGDDAELLRAMVLDPADLGDRSSHYLQLLARTAPGLDATDGQARLDDLLRRWEEAYPDRHDPNLEGHPIEVVELRERMVGDTRASLLLAMGAVGLILLIACANIANLMLVRARGRRREMALRRALGAGRGDLVRHLLVESLLLGLAGAAGGLVLAVGGLRLMEVAGGTFLPGVEGVGLDGVALAFTLLLGVVTSVAFGLAAAFVADEGGLRGALTAGDVRSTRGRGGLRVRRGLVVAEVGTAVLLVVGAGLLLRSVARLQGVDPGFEPEGVVVASFSLTTAAYPEPGDVARFHRTLDQRLRALPAVEEVGAIRSLPLRDGAMGIESIEIVDRPRTDEEEAWEVAGYQIVNPGYFEAMGIPVLEGRLPTWSDDTDAVPVAVINRTMALAFWGGQDPLGERFRLGPEDWGNPVLTVVGVVADVRQAGLTGDPSPRFFVPRAQATAIYGGLGIRYATLVVRAGSEPGATLRALRETVSALDPDLPVVRTGSMDEIVTRSQGDTRALGVLLSAFSILALILGAVGIYGLVAHSVTSRTREIGVRIALGARPGEVVGSVLGEGVLLAGVGVVLGVAGALAGARLLESLLYGVGVYDPVAYIAGPAILLGVAVLAALLPARRAARIDPVEAMRAE